MTPQDAVDMAFAALLEGYRGEVHLIVYDDDQMYEEVGRLLPVEYRKADTFCIVRSKLVYDQRNYPYTGSFSMDFHIKGVHKIFIETSDYGNPNINIIIVWNTHHRR